MADRYLQASGNRMIRFKVKPMDSGKNDKIYELIQKLKRSKAEDEKLEKAVGIFINSILEFEKNTERKVWEIHLSREIKDLLGGEEEELVISLKIT